MNPSVAMSFISKSVGVVWVVLCLVSLTLVGPAPSIAAPPAPPAPPAPSAPDTTKPYFTDSGQLGYAEFLLRERDYESAAREFARLIEEFPASRLRAEAQLGHADALMGAGRFGEAALEFRLFLFNFADSPLAPRAARGYMDSRARLRERAAVRPPVRTPAPGASAPAPERLKAVQVMFFDGRTRAEIDSELASLRGAGVNTVIVRAFHNRGDRYWPLAVGRGPAMPGRGVNGEAGVYFRTTHAPVVADILPVVADLAHNNGLKVFAWMTTRYADYGLEDRPELACVGYDLESRGPVRCKGLDVFNDRAVEHIASIYRDLADVAIDGVLFQDDLVLRHTEGFGAAAERGFRRDTGHTLDPEALYVRLPEGRNVRYTRLFWKWAAWKNKRLLYVAERARRAVREKRPGARFAINLMYENLTNPPYALAWLSQDLARARKAGFDYYSVMAYHRQMSEELGASAAEVASMIGEMVRDASEAVGEPNRVLIKLQTVDWNTGRPLSNREVVSLIRRVRSAGPVSLAVVPYRSDFPFFELAPGDRVAGLAR